MRTRLKKLLPAITCCLLVLCIVLTAVLLVQRKNDRDRENFYMIETYRKISKVYEDTVRQCGEETQTVEARLWGLQQIMYGLHEVGAQLENGGFYVNSSIPHDASMWFHAKAADLRTQYILGPAGHTEEEAAFLELLRDDLYQLLEPLTEEGGMEDVVICQQRDLRMEQFSEILSDFAFEQRKPKFP